MTSFREVLEFEIYSRMGFVNITAQAETALRERGIREGFCLVNG